LVGGGGFLRWILGGSGFSGGFCGRLDRSGFCGRLGRSGFCGRLGRSGFCGRLGRSGFLGRFGCGFLEGLGGWEAIASEGGSDRKEESEQGPSKKPI